MADPVSGIQSSEQAQAYQMLAICIQTPGPAGDDQALGVPVLLWGMPGVAKTARMNKLVTMLGKDQWKLVTVLASLRQPEDFLGIPVPQPDKRDPSKMELRYVPAEWVRELQDSVDNPSPAKVGIGRKGALFLDEFATAAPVVQAALLRVVHERVVGDEDLPRNTAMVAAANPPAMSPGGEVGLTLPTANRFLHIWWPNPDAQQWADWLLGVDEGRVLTPVVSRPAFDAMYEKYKSYGSMYVLANPDQLFDTPPEGQMEAAESALEGFNARAYAWPSPRSWELALRAAAGAMAAVDDRGTPLDVGTRADLAEQMICAAVGDVACEQFNQFVVSLDIKPPEEYLSGRERFRHDKTRPDRTRVVLRSMFGHARANPTEAHRAFEWMLNLLERKHVPQDAIVPIAVEADEYVRAVGVKKDPVVMREIVGYFLKTLKTNYPAMMGG